MNREEATREMEQMLGAVPGFMSKVPDRHVGALWETMKGLQLLPGQIPPKYQQLIMLAVSTHAECRYCTDFHTEVGRAAGATSEEIAETALLAASAAQWSRFLGGMQYDLDQFKREVRVTCAHLRKSHVSTNPRSRERPRA